VKTARFVCSSVAVALVATGLVAGGDQRSVASVVVSVAIYSPQDGATVTGDVDVEAQANGPEADPPQKIEFFVDAHTRPAATVECLTSLADPSAYCGGKWLWHSGALVGHHSLSAKAVLLDGSVSGRSQAVHVVVTAQTHVTVHRAKHPVEGHLMILAGQVRSLSKGRPGARRVPVTVTTTPEYGTDRTFHLRTNRHGYYRKKIRAVNNTSITVATQPTREYFAASASYTQYVQGRPRCGLSRDPVGVKQTVVLRCRMRWLSTNSRFLIQERIHGTWHRAAAFTTTRQNRTKIYIRPRKRGTIVMREVFPTNAVYARSSSNVVWLHVT
jgi:Bacterial Ig domain